MPTMPELSRKAFRYLRLEALGLVASWYQIFRPLFDGDNAIVFYDYAANAYSEIQWALLDRVCVSLTRLADHCLSKDAYPNICLEHLISTISKQSDGKLVKSLKKRLKIFRNKCVRFKTRRNVWIAHRNLDSVDVTEPSFSRANVEEALTALNSFMNDCQLYFDNCETDYRNTLMSDAETSLIRFLRLGVERQEQILHGMSTLPESKATIF